MIQKGGKTHAIHHHAENRLMNNHQLQHPILVQSTKKYSNTKLDTMNKYKTLYEEMLKEAQRDGGNTLDNDTCGGGTSGKFCIIL